MKVNGNPYRTVWFEGSSMFYIEQNLLPFEFRISEAKSYKETCAVIKNMGIRGAGAIGAAAGFAMAQAFIEAPKGLEKEFVDLARKEIESARPTARNLFYATEKVFLAGTKSTENAVQAAHAIANNDAADSKKIGEFGNILIRDGAGILTHCNAGWLAFVDYGTALSPIYAAHEHGRKIHVYVDETRPRSQGARLTSWELMQAGVPHSIIPDNAAASLMAQGMIDLVITGADRIARNGDVANKIGTLEKAICASFYHIPFYIAAPLSTFDLNCESGHDIPIEYRSQDEVLYQTGPDSSNLIHTIRVANPGAKAINPAFDVTPANLITGIITEKGIIIPTEEEIKKLF
ncbi:MAG: S-methyl-5-thioribose-1-phosphate isomerase [Bacteroidetes bacterium]|nr:S-methyl-5-thioribose-1-phosphate isomerase [Bacteroidota bacterium]MBU1721059.1 S-methyl-5-thioribose-1-phosphate isomerase [Bacteroidota bacterium]